MNYSIKIKALLTLGNKKSVDIIVTKEKGDLITIDVKGIANKYDWPADNIKTQKEGIASKCWQQLSRYTKK